MIDTIKNVYEVYNLLNRVYNKNVQPIILSLENLKLDEILNIENYRLYRASNEKFNVETYIIYVNGRYFPIENAQGGRIFFREAEHKFSDKEEALKILAPHEYLHNIIGNYSDMRNIRVCYNDLDYYSSSYGLEEIVERETISRFPFIKDKLRKIRERGKSRG